MVKKHVRPNPQRNIKGGIAEQESPIAISNVMLVCSGATVRTRVGHELRGDAKCAFARSAATRSTRHKSDTLPKMMTSRNGNHSETVREGRRRAMADEKDNKQQKQQKPQKAAGCGRGRAAGQGRTSEGE